jgi:hypothetical protein
MEDTSMGYEDFDVEPVDFDDDVEFEEIDEELVDAELALLAARVRAARFAGA